MQNLKFAFFGTPDVAVKTLEIMKQNGYLPSLIVTSPDSLQGRKMLLTPTPVKIWAEQNHVSFLQPEKLDDQFIKKFSVEAFDIAIVVAYGKIMPAKLLETSKMGFINIHYSLLPKYRGASPVETAVLNGEIKTGVTIQQMKFKMDSGPVLIQEETEIFPEETALQLRERLIKIGGKLLSDILPKIINKKIKPIPQNEDDASFSKKIKKEDGLIDLSGNPLENYNKFRAYAGWPRIFFFLNGKRIIITEAKLQDGKFQIKKVLPEGKKEISYEQFLKNNTQPTSSV